jgi:hypothetical protein
MENLEKYENEEFQLKNNLRRVGDLINMEGPMLVVFQDTENGDLYLFDWVDNDEIFNRWLIFRTSKSDLIDFLKKNISYKTLFDKNTLQIFYSDISVDQMQAYKIFDLRRIPISYKPDKDVLFDSSDSKNLDKILSVLDLDNNLDEKTLSKVYNNVISITSYIHHPTQNIIPIDILIGSTENVVILTDYPNYLTIYTQQNVSENNRILESSRMVLQY